MFGLQIVGNFFGPGECIVRFAVYAGHVPRGPPQGFAVGGKTPGVELKTVALALEQLPHESLASGLVLGMSQVPKTKGATGRGTLAEHMFQGGIQNGDVP